MRIICTKNEIIIRIFINYSYCPQFPSLYILSANAFFVHNIRSFLLCTYHPLFPSLFISSALSDNPSLYISSALYRLFWRPSAKFCAQPPLVCFTMYTYTKISRLYIIHSFVFCIYHRRIIGKSGWYEQRRKERMICTKKETADVMYKEGICG